MLWNRFLSAGIATGLFAGAALASDGIGNLSLTATSCNPEIGATVQFAISGPPGAAYTVRAGQPGCSYLPGVGPIDLVWQSSSVIASGTLPASGMTCIPVAVSYPDLTDVVFQGFATNAGSPTGTAVSNAARVEVSSQHSMNFSNNLLPSMPALTGGKAAYGDVDGDGDVDVYVPTTGNGISPSMETQNLLLLNDGAGHFTNATATNLPAVAEATNRAVLVDLDGDFDLDIVTANGKRSISAPYPTVSRIYRNDGTGHFAVLSELPGGADYLQDIAAGDVDGDGDVDLVLGRDGNGAGAPERLLINNGSAVFTDGTGGSTGGNGNGGGGGGNGHGNGGGGGGNGGGGGGGNTATTGITAIVDPTFAVQLVDVDADGDSDLVTANGENGGARVYLNNGTGLFTALSGAFPTADSSYANDMGLGDIDGDGDVDAILVIRTSVLPLVRDVRVFVNNGHGSFTRSAGAVSGIPTNDQVYNVAVGDLDGDGDLDATVVTSSQALDWMLINDGAGHLAAVAGVPAPSGTALPVLFDANGDNVLDVAYAANAGAGTLRLLTRQ
jgi:uncharacterized membrane protein YgcG